MAPRFLVPALEVILAVVILAETAGRFDRETRFTRYASLAFVAVAALTNLSALILLLTELLQGGENDPGQLLVASLQVWLTNVIVFGVAFWELDRGGPVQRKVVPRAQLPAADFRFPQDEDNDAVIEVAKGSSDQRDWMPSLIDYLYVSLTNSTAFSPTDTMPLTPRAKVLMAFEASSALMVSLLIIARAVGSLQS